MQIVRPLRPDLEPAASQYWFERIDVESHRDFRPVVTVPRPSDRRLGDLADRFDRLLQLPLTGSVLASSMPTLARGLADPSRLLDDWSFYIRPELVADPDLFFERPPEGWCPPAAGSATPHSAHAVATSRTTGSRARSNP